MSAYGPLAPWYDTLTTDVPYTSFVKYYESIFSERGKKVDSVLDLACGTGTLSAELATRGYDVISVDKSADMLAEAMEKFYSLPDNCKRPMALCQPLDELDLFGTSDAAVSCLDSMNYLSAPEITAFFQRVRYFLEPKGLLIFDINEPAYFRALDGQTCVDERENLLCLWRASLIEDDTAISYGMDVFKKRGSLWARDSEEHIEYIHTPEFLEKALSEAGFLNIEIRKDGPLSENGRLFFIAENGWYCS